jgi:triacylglycerol esterase/lipase EstA (alpha/beta hydrolase family)
VNEAVDKYGADCEIALIGHSIGGWIGRAWLSEWAQPDVKKRQVNSFISIMIEYHGLPNESLIFLRVVSLVSLGSPHQPPPADSLFSSSDQTRGLLSYINTRFPGTHDNIHSQLLDFYYHF